MTDIEDDGRLLRGGRPHVAAPSDPDLYRDSFYAVPLVSFLTDGRAIIVDASRTAAAFLNVATSALLMKPLLHFIARGDTRAFRTLIREIGTDQIGPFVARLRPRHGTPRAMTMTARSVGGRSNLIWIALPAQPGPR
jgi:PAS domain-containing protein